MRSTGAAFAVVMAVATACASTSAGNSSSTTSEPTTSVPPTSPARAAAPALSDPLRGIGATKSSWISAHGQPDPKYSGTDCCFGARITVSDGTVDEWAAVLYNDNPPARVYNFTRNFAAGTDQSLAVAEVLRDLPADARMVKQKKYPTCFQQLYRSRQLLRYAGPDLGGSVLISLYSSADGSYRSSQVEQAIVTVAQDIADC